MNSVLIATLGGLVAALGWGSGDWLTAKLSKKFDKLELNLGANIPGLLVMLPILLMSSQAMPSGGFLARMWLAGALISAGFMCMVTALRSGAVGIVVPLSNIYAILTLALSTVFLGSVFNAWQILAIFIIVAGAVLLAYEKNHQKIPLKELHRETFFALVAALIWGVAFFLVNTMVGDFTWYVLSGWMTVFMTLNALLLVVLSNGSETLKVLKRPLKNKTIWLSGLAFQFGAMGFYIGSEKSRSVIIPAVIAAAAPLVSSGLAAVYDHEKVGLIKRLGAAVVVAGIIILNLV